MQKRMQCIHRLMTYYSLGDFSKRVAVSEELDETDAVIGGLHMLAEELRTRTVPMDYFSAVWNGVKDGLLLLSMEGVILDVNQALLDGLGYSRLDLVGQWIGVLSDKKDAASRMLWRDLQGDRTGKREVSLSWRGAGGDRMAVWAVTRSLLVDGLPRVLLVVRKSEVQDTGWLVTVEERVRQEIARNLHDDIGQQLSAIKFMMTLLGKEKDSDRRAGLMEQLELSLSEAIKDLRNVCFNLMPHTLSGRGFSEAIQELAARCQPVGLMANVSDNMQYLSEGIQLDVFRIVQELVHNAIRHGAASRIVLGLVIRQAVIHVRLVDNGRGFDPLLAEGSGMGLANVRERIRLYGGTWSLKADPKRGTQWRIQLPVKGDIWDR